MSEQKHMYTADGKKVAVIGKLNDTQWIVQEIYVSGGSEVPAGNNFVVDALLDEPMETHKEKRLREIEDRLARVKQAYDHEFGDLRRREAATKKKAKLRISAFSNIASNADESKLQTLLDFLSGDVTHFFVDSYKPSICTWDDNGMFQVDTWNARRDVQQIKLVSLFGRSNGDLEYRLHQYSDGSGCGGTRIVPCRSYGEALSHAQEAFDVKAQEFLDSGKRAPDIDAWSKIDGLTIPREVTEKLTAIKSKLRNEKIKKLRAELAELLTSQDGDR